MKRWFIYILILLPFTGFSQIDPEVTLETSTRKILIGEQIDVTLTLKVNASDDVYWPVIGDTLRSEVEVVSQSGIDTVYDENDISIKYFTQTIKVTSFDSGYFAIKPFKFLINEKELESRPFLVESHTVQINPEEEIKDIKSPFQAEMTFMDYVRMYWKTTSLILLIVVLAGLIFWYLSKRKIPTIQQIIQKPIIPPHVIALEKLEKIESEKEWNKEDVKTYCSVLSETLREYIENRFNTLALEQTSDEILHSINSIGEISNSEKENLRQFLQTTDLVKFAKHRTLPEENKKLLEVAKNFVENTIPEEKVAVDTETIVESENLANA